MNILKDNDNMDKHFVSRTQMIKMGLKEIKFCLLIIGICGVGYVAPNPCAGAHKASFEVGYSFEHRMNESIDRAQDKVISLQENIKRLEELYNEQNRFLERNPSRELNNFNTRNHHIGTCAPTHVHVKQGAVYHILQRSERFVRATLKAETEYSQTIRIPDVIRNRLRRLQEGILNLMCDMHKLRCRIRTYVEIIRVVDEDIETLESRSQRFSRDKALLNHLNQVLTCTASLLQALRQKVTPTNGCHGVVTECKICHLLP